MKCFSRFDYFYLYCSYIRIDPSVLPAASLSELVRTLTDISVRALPALWLPPVSSLSLIPNQLPSTNTNNAVNTVNTDSANTISSGSNSAGVSGASGSGSDEDRPCQLRQAVLTLLSALARTRKYDEVLKNDCMSVLITYASLGGVSTGRVYRTMSSLLLQRPGDSLFVICIPYFLDAFHESNNHIGGMEFHYCFVYFILFYFSTDFDISVCCYFFKFSWS